MNVHSITIEGSSSVRLPVAGKYCDRDIVVTAVSDGVELPALSSPGAAADLMAGKQMLNGKGEIVDGAFTLETEMTEQDALIERIKAALQGKAAGGSGLPTQEKTVEITENGTVEVLPDEGYALSKVAVNVNVSAGAEGLPNGYARADCIRFTGEQIVDTGVVCTQNTKIRMLFTRDSDDSMYMYGVVNSGNTASVTAYMTSSSGSWRFGNKYSAKDIVANEELVQTAIVTKTGFIRADDTASISGVNDFETIGSLTIGAVRNADGTVAAAQFIGKILFFEMWDGSTKVLKLVPVTDGKGTYRFWDAVGQKFHDSITDTPLEGGSL